MRIELICVGSELLSDKINTHIAYIGAQLNSIGLNLDLATTVSDNFDSMVEVFTGAFERADIVIVTGGLGPTFDDLTRETVSKALKKKLVFDKNLLEPISKIFTKRGIEMPEDNRRQAYLIEGATAILNNHGTAPGQLIKPGNPFRAQAVFLLPGPSKELYPMFEETVLPSLKQQHRKKIIKSKIIHTFGFSESKVNEMIKPIIESETLFDRNVVAFTILAHNSVVDLKIKVSTEDELLADEILHNLSSEFYETLGQNIYGESAATLGSTVAALLIKSKKTVSLAESCTGGLTSDKLTDIPGSSAFFLEGIVAYSNTAKINLLKVLPQTLEKFGAVSEQTALEMAKGIKELAHSDYGLSVTGIAGPDGGTSQKPVGTVCFGLSAPSADKTFKCCFIGNRKEIKERAALFALDILRRELVS